jgi:hypothetical protein
LTNNEYWGPRGEFDYTGRGPYALNGAPGADGVDGAGGADGLSAYEIYLSTTTDDPALTLEQWLASMVGAPGADGADGAATFLELTDSPASYSGQGGKIVAVKADATGLEFVSGGEVTIVTDATTAITLDGTNCYPDYIRCTSGSAVTLTLAAGQSAAVGRHWIIRQAAAGVATVSANDSTPAAITRNGDPSTAGQHTEIAVILVADGVLDIVGGAA